MPKLIPDFKVWFDVPEEQQPGRVEIRHLLDGELAEIFNRTVEVRLVYGKDGKVIRNGSQDPARESELIMIRSVTAWEDFADAEGRELECTPENLRLFARQDWFLPFIRQCREKVAKLFAGQQEAKLKNSKALPSGSPALAGKAAKIAG